MRTRPRARGAGLLGQRRPVERGSLCRLAAMVPSSHRRAWPERTRRQGFGPRRRPEALAAWRALPAGAPNRRAARRRTRCGGRIRRGRGQQRRTAPHRLGQGLPNRAFLAQSTISRERHQRHGSLSLFYTRRQEILDSPTKDSFQLSGRPRLAANMIVAGAGSRASDASAGI